MSARWMLKLERADEPTRNRAAKELFRVNHAILTLENARLADIRDDLLQNEPALLKGTQRLRKALENLNKVKTVLNAVTGLLSVVGKIVAIFA